MHMCVNIYVYVCEYLYINIYIWKYLNIHHQINIYIYTNKNMYIYIYAYCIACKPATKRIIVHMVEFFTLNSLANQPAELQGQSRQGVSLWLFNSEFSASNMQRIGQNAEQHCQAHLDKAFFDDPPSVPANEKDDNGQVLIVHNT